MTNAAVQLEGQQDLLQAHVHDALASATAHTKGQQHPIKLYLVVWGWLFVLSTCSYLVDYFGLHGYLRWSLILLFMVLKAGLIVAVFMLGAGLVGIGPGYAQDAASGEKIFVQCKACHQIGENAKNAVGPVLNGLFGRKAGMIEGYSYSSANKNSGITWDEATFREYIKDPKAKIPGTKMTFPGLKDPKQIDDIVAYLKQFDSEGKKTGAVTVPAGRKFTRAL